MTHRTPKAFDFGDGPEPAPDPADRSATPRAFNFDDAQDAAPAAPVDTGPPGALSFDELPAAPANSALTRKAAPKALFDSEDHPAVRDALATARTDFPALFAHAEPRLAALFRRILPVRLSLVMEWGEGALMEQAALLQPMSELVLAFTQLGVPALLDAALDSTRPPTGVLGRLLRRPTPPALYRPALTSARAQLVQLLADSELATRRLEESAQELNLHGAALAVVATLAANTPDASLLDALVRRRTLIQQALRQAELSILQMGQVRQQAADLIGQVSSFLTVTLPALEMAQAQGGAAKP